MTMVYLLSKPRPKATPAAYHASSPCRFWTQERQSQARPQQNTKGGSMVISTAPTA